MGSKVSKSLCYACVIGAQERWKITSAGEGFDRDYFDFLASVLHPRHILTR